MSLVEARRQLALVRAARAVIDGREVALHRWLDELSTTPGNACVDAGREVVAHAGLRRRDVRVVEARSHTVEKAPVLGELLAAGVTTAGHVDAVGQALAAAGDDRDALLGQLPVIAERAVSMDADSFGRYVQRLARDVCRDEGMSRFRQQQRSTYMKVWSDREGMVRLSGAFDPERGAVLAGRLGQQVEAMFHSGDRDVVLDVAAHIDPNDHRRALALHRLCTRRTSSGGAGACEIDGDPFDTRPTRAEIVVHVDIDTLRSGLHPASVCRTVDGHDLPPPVVRRLACDADVVPVVLSGGSVPLDVGRAKRLATVHQRRALEAVHATCAIPECEVSMSRCVVHHLDPWEGGGPTDLANLVPLCNRHHHDVHDNGWQLAVDAATRQVVVIRPGSTAGTASGASRHRRCAPSSGDIRPSCSTMADGRRIDAATGEIVSDPSPPMRPSPVC